MVTVREKRLTVEPRTTAQANPGGNLLADEPGQPCKSERDEVIGAGAGSRDGRRPPRRRRTPNEDGEHDGVAGPPFSASTDREERGAERYRSQRVPDVVDQVREERNRPGEDEHDRLKSGAERDMC
jgi:hypothetical protein